MGLFAACAEQIGRTEVFSMQIRRTRDIPAEFLKNQFPIEEPARFEADENRNHLNEFETEREEYT